MGREIRRYFSEDFDYYLVTPYGFEGIELPVMRRKETNEFYWPIIAISEDVLGIDGGYQLRRIRANGKTAKFVQEIEVEARTGLRKPAFLEFEGLAPWFDMLQTGRMKDGRVKEAVERFQASAVRAVNEILWGKIQPVSRQQLATEQAEQRPTLAGTNVHLRFLEGRVEAIEKQIFRPTTYVNENDDEGVLNIPFTVERPGRYVARLRNVPWSLPELIEIVREDE